MMNEPLTFYPKHPSNLKTLIIETKPMPICPRRPPFRLKPFTMPSVEI